jgi:hypothetical protein
MRFLHRVVRNQAEDTSAWRYPMPRKRETRARKERMATLADIEREKK